MNMLKGYTQADYSAENWKILLDIKAAADVEIDNAASVTDVMAALNNAETAMEAVHTLLEDAKAAAHAGLNAALAGYAQGDYSPENWTVLLNAMAIADTDNAASVEDVTAALNNAQEAMAAVHTLLIDAKIAAHAGLDAALEGYAQEDYTPDDWTALNAIKTAGDTAIDEAAHLAGVEAAQSEASAGMAGVQTIAQTLAAAKSAAHDALAAALGLNESKEEPADEDLLACAAETEAVGTETEAVGTETEAVEAETETVCTETEVVEAEAEVADTDAANDAVEAPQEEPVAESGTPEAAEEKTDAEPAPESSSAENAEAPIVE